MEVWKDIQGYEGLYSISSEGVVKAAAKSRGTNYSVFYPEKILNPYVRSGYYVIPLSNLGVKKSWFLHRLMAIHFIPNPLNLPEVNHIDGNKLNFKIDNLEWCTRLENERHAWETGLKSMIGDNHSLSKRVLQMDLNDNIIKEWTNGHQAMQETGFANAHISRCCRGLAKQAYGFKWSYA